VPSAPLQRKPLQVQRPRLEMDQETLAKHYELTHARTRYRYPGVSAADVVQQAYCDTIQYLRRNTVAVDAYRSLLWTVATRCCAQDTRNERTRVRRMRSIHPRGRRLPRDSSWCPRHKGLHQPRGKALLQRPVPGSCNGHAEVRHSPNDPETAPSTVVPPESPSCHDVCTLRTITAAGLRKSPALYRPAAACAVNHAHSSDRVAGPSK
jgi:hypothetical protein